jgi:hypothetical protein
MDHSIKQGNLSNVFPKIKNTKLRVFDFNEKVWKFLSPYLTNEFRLNLYHSFHVGTITLDIVFVNIPSLVMVKSQNK